MKKILSLTLACVLALSLFAGCSGKSGAPANSRTPEELTALYASAITGARDAEMNEFYPVISTLPDADAEGGAAAAYTLEVLGLQPEDLSAFGVSVSLMNVQAYAVVAVMPVEGKHDAVVSALNTYIENQQSAFENYLPEPYEHAKNAKLDTLSDGTVLLVMCENQDTVFDAVSSAITGA